MNMAKGLLTEVANNNRLALLCGAGILALGVGLGSAVLANGLVRMQRADREVTVRGVAQRDVTANRANWSVNFSENAYALPEALAKVDHDTGLIRAFLKDQGFSGSVRGPGGSMRRVYRYRRACIRASHARGSECSGSAAAERAGRPSFISTATAGRRGRSPRRCGCAASRAAGPATRTAEGCPGSAGPRPPAR